MSSIVVTQGDTWTCQAGWYNPIAGVNPPQPDLNSPVDLTGYTAKLQVRPAPGMPAVLSLTSSPPAGLTINDAEGTIDIVATAAQTGEARRLPDGNWEFYINNVLQFTHSAHLPTTGLNVAMVVRTNENVAKNIDVDYFAIRTVGAQRWT